MKLRIKLEGKTYDVEVEFLPEPAGTPREFRSEDSANGELGFNVPASVLRPCEPLDILPEERICRSPIAGVIVAVSAAANQFVTKDQPVVTIEAMKMESKIGAPLDGVIETVNVRPGDVVKPGQILFKVA